MPNRYWLYSRSNGFYYVQDRVTGRQTSLKTKDAKQAKLFLAARNQAAETPGVNVAMARAYLSAKSPDLCRRTWKDVMDEVGRDYEGATLERWRRVERSPALSLLLNLPLLETDSSHFLAALSDPRSGNSLNRWLRTIHLRALDLGWLLSPVLTRRTWPKYRSRKRRALTRDQHEALLAIQGKDEYRHYLEMLWETGGSQADIAQLDSRNVNLAAKRIVYGRQKLAGRGLGQAAICIGATLQALLAKLPKEGHLFPTLGRQTSTVRSLRFAKHCRRLGFQGISLHSYRYAWAQRAYAAGMPMREAMAHLGHGSKAVHQAYSEQAETVTLPLEYYEAQRRDKLDRFEQEIRPLRDSRTASHSLAA
jgi:integrase